MRKNVVLFLVAGLLALSALGGVAVAQQKANVVVKEWRIPTIYFLSGPMAGICESHKWLGDHTIADINAAGGIAGKPAVLDYCDSSLDPTKAAACMARAIDSGALAINGPLNDMESKAAMPMAVRAGIFCFSGTSTKTVTQQFYPWTIYTVSDPDISERVQMELWTKHEPGIKSVTNLEEPLFPMIHALHVGYIKNLENMKIKTNGIIQAPSGMVDYGPIVVKAMATKADAFIIGASEGVSAKLVKGLVAEGVNPKHIYMESGFVGPTFLQDAKGSCEGVYSPTSPTYSPNPVFAKYSKAYRESHNGRPWGGFTPITYDMLHMIKNAIEETGATGDPAKVKEERTKIKDWAISQKAFKGMDATYDVVKGVATHYPQRLFQVKSATDVALVEEMIP